MYHYKECGLDNVWLSNGYKEYDTPYGKAYAVQHVDGLLKAIAMQLVKKPARLTGKELRFLRVQMRLSQQEMGDLQGVSAQMVSLWERKNSIPMVNDHWVRVQYIDHVKSYDKVEEVLREIRKAKEQGETCITVNHRSGEWKSRSQRADNHRELEAA